MNFNNPPIGNHLPAFFNSPPPNLSRRTEILPRTDPRYPDVSTPYALREDRAFGVVYHHERTPASLTDTSILHVELAGRYLIAPARVELMYDTLTRGHSAAFEFRVE